MPAELADTCGPTSRCSRASASTTRVVGPAEVARLVPGAVTDDIAVAAYEPESGYADPSGTAAGFLAAARARGARLSRAAACDAVAGRR